MADIRLFHDICKAYAAPVVPAVGDDVRLTVRVQGEATCVRLGVTEKLFFALDDDYAYRDASFAYERDGFMYYTAEIARLSGTVKYRFSATDTAGNDVHTPAFLLVPGYDTPLWSKRAVWYQIMPDSFYNGDVVSDKPTSGVVKENAWGRGHYGGEDYFGGDLDGVIAKLDYLQSLGVTAISINPIWAATHQAGYGADDLTDVDHGFGGDAALLRLREETRKRGMRLCLDGVFDYLIYKSEYCNREGLYPLGGGMQEGDPYYDWFLRDGAGNLVGSFWDHPLADFSCDAYRDYAYRAPDSVMQTYLRPPYDIDGWRMDVGNIYEGSDPVHFGNAADVMRDMREHLKRVGTDKLLITENDIPKMRCYAAADSKWNYELGLPVRDWAAGKLNGQDFAAAARESITMLPRPMAQACFNHVTTHDTARILDTVDGKENAGVAATILHMAMLGAPSIYFGDEIGMRGDRYPGNGLAAPTSFGSMYWDTAHRNTRLLRLYTVLGNLRTQYAEFFCDAGVEFVYAEGDAAAYVRFDGTQICLAIGNRGDSPARLSVDLTAYMREGELCDALTGKRVRVQGGKLSLSVPAGGTLLIPASWHTVSLPDLQANESDFDIYDDYTVAARACGAGGLCVAQGGQELRFERTEKGLRLSLCGGTLAEVRHAGDVWLQLEKQGARWSACYSDDGAQWTYAATRIHCNFCEYTVGTCGEDVRDFRVGDGVRRRDYKARAFSLSAAPYVASIAPPAQHIASGDFAYAYGGIEQRGTLTSELRFDGVYTRFKAIFTPLLSEGRDGDFVALAFGKHTVGVRRGEIYLDGLRAPIDDAALPISVLATGERLLVRCGGDFVFSVPYTPSPVSLSFVGNGRYTLRNYGAYHDDVPYFPARGKLFAMDEGWDLSSEGGEYGYMYAALPLTDFVFSANLKFNVSASTYPDGYAAIAWGGKMNGDPEREGVTVRFYKEGGKVELRRGDTVLATANVPHLDNESFYVAMRVRRGNVRLSVAPNEFERDCREVLRADTGYDDGGCLLFAVRHARLHICDADIRYDGEEAEQEACAHVRLAPSKHRYMI